MQLSDCPTSSQGDKTHAFTNEHLGSYPGLSCMPFELYHILVVVGCDFLQPKQSPTNVTLKREADVKVEDGVKEMLDNRQLGVINR